MRRWRILLVVGAAMALVAPIGIVAAEAAPPTGWAGEKLLSGTLDAWEPFVAADPSSTYVYAIYNRYSGPLACAQCPSPPVVVQASSDGGKTWAAPVFVCACKGIQGQFDPTIHVTSTGVAYAMWMNWNTTVFSRSTDHGRTWSAPIDLSPNRWTDHPWFGASADGRDVYAFWAQGDAWEVHSHDAGVTWSSPVKINVDQSHYYYPNGVAVLPDGTVLMAASSYPCGKGTSQCSGPVNITVFRSTNAGATYGQQTVETLNTSVDFFTSSTTTLASDATGGNVVLEYNGAATVGANGEMFVRRSTDGGATWGARVEVSTGPGANASFPAIAGGSAGRFVLTYMDDRLGQWNEWYRSSTDGGATWSGDVRISDASSGAAYKTSAGFNYPYGDYSGIALTSAGKAVAAWGEGTSSLGPGGIWVNRQT